MTDGELLILGDVFDVGLDLPDDEWARANDENHIKPHQSRVPGLDPEMIEVQMEEEEDLDGPLEHKLSDDWWWGCRSTRYTGDITRYIKL